MLFERSRFAVFTGQQMRSRTALGCFFIDVVRLEQCSALYHRAPHSRLMEPRRYLARDFQAIHGIHPYCMSEERFKQLHGFGRRAARDMGMCPETGCSLHDSPPQPYVEGPTPWTSFVPGVYRTSLRFVPEDEPRGDAESLACRLIHNGQVTWKQLRELFALLPTETPQRAFQVGPQSIPQHEGMDTSGSFSVGGYSHKSFHGLRRHTRHFPWTCSLLCSLVRSIHYAHRFTTISLICNVQSLMHMDSHNDDQTCNLILPFSAMEEASCGWNTMRVISN